VAGSGIDVTLTIYGYNRLENKLRRIAADNPEIGDVPIQEFAQEQRAVLKSEPYPPKRPGQRYVRTGQLANRWAVVREASSRYQIINQARSKRGVYYAGYVVGKQQAWMHKGRWWQAWRVLQRNMHKLTEKLTSIYRKIWNG
jgi:hypothetical protein